MRSDSRGVLLQPHFPEGTATMTVAWGVGRKPSVLDSKVSTVCPSKMLLKRWASVQPPSLIFSLSCYCLWPENWGPEDLSRNPSWIPSLNTYGGNFTHTYMHSRYRLCRLNGTVSIRKHFISTDCLNCSELVFPFPWMRSPSDPIAFLVTLIGYFF